MLRRLRFLALLLLLALAPAARAQTVPPGSVERIATRPGVTVPVYVVWKEGALATVVLFSGGGGGYGRLEEDGWPGSGNFLIRTGKRWASHPFNVAMVGRPSDGIDLSSGTVRAGDEHAADTRAILRALKQRRPQPLWLVGTSMGTISVASAATRDDDSPIDGIVLTSSITGDAIQGAVPTLELERIRAPTLIVHHARDACRHCQPQEAQRIEPRLRNATRHQTLIVEGGEGAHGNYCGAFHHHGFIGREDETVDLVARWILQSGE